MTVTTKVIISIFVLLVIGAIIGGVVYATVNKNRVQVNDLSKQVFGPKQFMGRYVKIFRPSLSLSCFHVAEMKVFSVPGGPNIIKPDMIVTMSSTFSNTKPDQFPAKFLIDGKDNKFAHTACDDPNPLIMVDLGSMMIIDSVLLVTRTGCCGNQINGTMISIMDDDKKVVYSSDPIKSPKGSIIPNNDNDDNFKFNTYTIPSKTPLGTN